MLDYSFKLITATILMKNKNTNFFQPSGFWYYSFDVVM